MRRTRTRFGSLLLVLAMLLTLLPISAMAAEDDAYSDLANAIAAAPTNGTETVVTMTGDITGMTTDQIITIQEGQNIVLDMAGYSITVDKNNFEGRPIINYGTLKVTGNGAIDSSAAGSRGWGVINNFGTLTIENGFYDKGDGDQSATIYNRQDAILTINGGEIKGRSGPALISISQMTINGGNIWNTSCNKDSTPYPYYAVLSGGTVGASLTINGGEFWGTQGAVSVIGGTGEINNGSFKTQGCPEHGNTGNNIWYALYVAGEEDEVVCQVNGGVFSTDGSVAAVRIGNGADGGEKVSAAANLYGGTYSAPENVPAVVVDQQLTNVTAFIYGGTFSRIDNVEKYVAADYEIAQRGDQWVVGTLDEVAVAEVNNQKYLTLTEALNVATDGQTVKLLSNSTGNTQVVICDGRKLTLDMNGFNAGFTLKGNISIVKGSLDIVGEGKLYEEQAYFAPVMLYGSKDASATDYTTVTVGKNVTLEGWSGLFIDNNGGCGYGIRATVNGTLHSVLDITGAGGHALYVNGSIVAAEGNVPEIILNGATLNTDDGNGMYLAGYAKTTINDSTITSSSAGSTGIEIRAGELTINGNTTVKGGTGEFVVEPNGNGSTTGNVALAIVQHTTKLPTAVTINDGTFSGGAALFEQNAQNNDADAVAKIRVSVKGGTFKDQVYSENKTNFVSGGHFAQPVNPDYLDESLNTQLVSASNPEAPYSYYTSVSNAIAAAKPGDVVTPIQTGSTATTYTVTLNYNDGRTGNVTCTVEEDTSISLPRPTRTGYNFLGWYDGNTKVNSPYKVTGNATLVAQWSYIDQGGTTEPIGDYLVNVDRTTGGKITVNPGRADKGDTVTITVKPNDGYVLDELTVTAKDGSSVKLTWKDDNKYTFTMPGSQVSIEASFVKEGSQVVTTLPFTDVAANDWYYDAVQYVYENDLMNGTSAIAFSPFMTTSRAMILTILARYDGVDTSTGSTWYEAGAVWAIAEGVSDGTNLEANLTREQLVTMLWRYLGSPVVEGNLSGYPDSASVSDWAVNAMIWAVKNGVITGNGAGALNPQGTATRAEVATILMRVLEQ